MLQTWTEVKSLILITRAQGTGHRQDLKSKTSVLRIRIRCFMDPSIRIRYEYARSATLKKYGTIHIVQ